MKESNITTNEKVKGAMKKYNTRICAANTYEAVRNHYEKFKKNEFQKLMDDLDKYENGHKYM